jgi:hypothetical protein
MFSLARRPRIPRNLEDWLLAEIGRARIRLADLRREHPAAEADELARRLIEDKKQLAARGGAVTGLFGIAAVPADVALLGYLQLTLAIELAVLYGVNLKAAGGRQQLFDLFGWDQGLTSSLGPLLPALAARAGRAILRKSAWKAVGRTVPVLAAPLAAWLNHREIQRLGEAAVLSFGAFRRLHATAPPPTDA